MEKSNINITSTSPTDFTTTNHDSSSSIITHLPHPPQFARREPRLGNTPVRKVQEDIKPSQFGRRAILTEAKRENKPAEDLNGNPFPQFGRRNIISQMNSATTMTTTKKGEDDVKVAQFGRRHVLGADCETRRQISQDEGDSYTPPFFGRRRHIPEQKEVSPGMKPPQFGRRNINTTLMSNEGQRPTTALSHSQLRQDVKPAQFGIRIPRESIGSGFPLG